MVSFQHFVLILPLFLLPFCLLLVYIFHPIFIDILNKWKNMEIMLGWRLARVIYAMVFACF